MVRVILQAGSPEALGSARKWLGERHPLHPNLPLWWVEFDSGSLAELAVLNLNLLPGVKATLADNGKAC